MNIQELKQAMTQDDVSGCFLFYGEEDYLKQHYAAELRRHILDGAALPELNHTVFDAQDMTCAAILDAAKALPVMADRRVVEWRHADLEGMKSKDFERLLELCEEIKQEYPYTAFLILPTVEGLDVGVGKRVGDRLSKLQKATQWVYFPHSTDGQLVSWIHRHFAHEKLNDSAEVCRLLLIRCGHDMWELSREIDKVVCFVKQKGRDTVTPADVETVTSVNRENDTYALSNALLDGNISLAFSCFEELKNCRTDPAIVAGQLFRVYADLATVSVLVTEGRNTDDIAKILHMNAYKAGLYVKAAKRMTADAVKNALEACKQTDLYYKSVYVNTYDQLEKLLIRIIGKKH